MLSTLPRPAIFAHRGASLYAPENTLAAFRLAVEQGADAIELDAKLSADGHVVVIHDQTVDRTTDGTGRVGELTLDALRRLDAGSHFGPEFAGEPVPTLEEVFAAVGAHLPINVELTNYASLRDRLPEKVAELVRRHGLEQRVLFSSFNPLALIHVRRELPHAPIGLLAMPGGRGSLARSWPGRLLNYDALHPAWEDATRRLIESAQRRGRRVHAYTVNQRPAMETLFDRGVDGIFTDDPILARQVLNR